MIEITQGIKQIWHHATRVSSATSAQAVLDEYCLNRETPYEYSLGFIVVKALDMGDNIRDVEADFGLAIWRLGARMQRLVLLKPGKISNTLPFNHQHSKIGGL